MGMRFFIYSVFIVVFSFCTYGQNEVNPNGFNKFYYPNGSLQSEGNLRNGKPDGYWKNYYPTGVVKSEGNRKNHKLDSIWIFYHISGNIESKINFLDGKKNGFSYTYYLNPKNPANIGKVKSKELYVENYKEGISEYYYEEGVIKENVAFVANKKEGRGIIYAKDGRIVTINKHRKGNIIEQERINRFNKEKKKHGIWKEFYADLKVKKEVSYKNGLLDGYLKEYSRNGTLKSTQLYKDDQLVEVVEEKEYVSNIEIEYYKNGNKKSEGSFIANKPIGAHKSFSEDGTEILSKVYNDNSVLIASGKVDKENRKFGTWTEYYPNGDERAKGNFVNNRRQGSWMFYYKSGLKEQEGKFEKGSYSGLWKWYYNSGELWKEEEYYNGRREGLYIEYDREGNVLVEGEYFDNEREGEWITRINDHRAEGKYVTGLMDGKWRHFFDNGTLSFEGNFIQGNPDGKHKFYFPNGNLKTEQFYSAGIRQKHWKKYNEEGKLIITISYKDDVEYRINGVKIDFPIDTPKVLQ